MIIRASIKNFLSFNQKTEILLTPGRTRSFTHHILRGKKARDIDVLKSSIFLGANASGKSNLIKAIDFVKKMVTNGPSRNEGILYEKFKLDPGSKNKNSRIEIEFKCQDYCYAFGFEFNNVSIEEEWLYTINKETESKIYERTTSHNNVSVDFGNIKIEKDAIKRLEFIGLDTNPNELFLFSCGTRNIRNIIGIDPITSAIDWFSDTLTIVFPDSKLFGMETNISSDKDLREIYRWFLTEFKTGITGLETIKVDFFSNEVLLPQKLKESIINKLEIGERAIISSLDDIRYTIFKSKEGLIEASKLMTKHKIKNKPEFINFEITEESDGTQRIMDLIPALTELCRDNKVFLIDEIERSLHPNLSYKMMELFFNESQGIASQLICTTHEDNYLDFKLFRKDEIWFVEKNRHGESQTSSLEEFKPRKDKDIRTGYLKGRYDGIPVFSSMKNAPWKN